MIFKLDSLIKEYGLKIYRASYYDIQARFLKEGVLGCLGHQPSRQRRHAANPKP